MAAAINIPYSPRGYPLRPNEVEVTEEEYLHSSYAPDMDYVARSDCASAANTVH